MTRRRPPVRPLIAAAAAVALGLLLYAVAGGDPARFPLEFPGRLQGGGSQGQAPNESR